ncbi:MAG: hypothetical protein IID43_01950, partial [Planctomycetes bacterium]|nr:hypothetical protein [Planctomycetota bacterium]
MLHSKYYSRPRSARRGIVAVVTIVLLVVLTGFAALTIDIGVMYNVRADLQDAADAAALAAGAALTTDEMMKVRQGSNSAIYEVVNLGRQDAVFFALRNPSLGTSATHLLTNEISFGALDLTSSTGSLDMPAAATAFNAVEVITRRDSKGPDGPVGALFSRVFGLSELNVAATATAAFDDRVGAFDTNYAPHVMPFSLSEDLYTFYLNSGPDDYTYDAELDQVGSGSDDIREVNIYPYDSAPGNFGLLNIGTPNQGIPGLRDHIEDGVPPEDFIAEIGTDVIIFSQDGSPVTYQITGSPGMDSSLEPSIDTQLGDVVSYFL